MSGSSFGAAGKYFLSIALSKNFEFHLEFLVTINFHFIGSNREILSCRNLLGRNSNYAFDEHNGMITDKNSLSLSFADSEKPGSNHFAELNGIPPILL